MFFEDIWKNIKEKCKDADVAASYQKSTFVVREWRNRSIQATALTETHQQITH